MIDSRAVRANQLRRLASKARTLAVVYVAILFAGTHFPKNAVAGFSWEDKLVHLSGYAVLTFVVLVGWELTIATQLSKLGYKTAHFGKWHIGSVDGRLPNDHGFDEWWGIPRTTDEVFWTSSPGFDKSGVEPQYIMEGRKGEKTRKVKVYDLEQRPLLDAEITRRTVDFMQRSVAEKKPFAVKGN